LAASAISPSPPHAVAESMTVTRSSPRSSSNLALAWSALSYVPDIPPAMWMETTSRPSATRGSKTFRKSPTDGCEVVGRSAAGGTWLIGSHVARALLQRGDDLRLTVRASSKTDNLEGLECETVRADIHDRRSLRRALKGVDRVFHVAGYTSLRAPAARLYRIN